MKQTVTLLIILLSSTISLTAQRASLPYYDDFESGAPGWVAWYDVQSGTNWELGEPTSGFTIGGYSGTRCWDVNLNSVYSNYAVCYLSSPVFDFSNVPVAHISFYTKYHTEYLWDYMSVQYTVDNGDTWEYLPFPELINPDGYVLKWTRSSLDVADLYGYSNVQFRFVFVSDNSIQYDGYSIDDFRIDIDELGISDPGNTTALNVYPNPSHGLINIDFKKSPGSTDQLIIYSADGKEVIHQQAKSENNLTLAKGIYTVVFESEDLLEIKKVAIVE